MQIRIRKGEKRPEKMRKSGPEGVLACNEGNCGVPVSFEMI